MDLSFPRDSRSGMREKNDNDRPPRVVCYNDSMIPGKKASPGGPAVILPGFLTQDADGEIRLTGHRIGLYTVVRSSQDGLSAERIQQEYPSLPLTLVYKVLAYYLDNRHEVDAYVSDYRAELERQEAAHVPSPAELDLRGRMEER
jgi:uncharacterized protein (DUF433 family)